MRNRRFFLSQGSSGGIKNMLLLFLFSLLWDAEGQNSINFYNNCEYTINIASFPPPGTCDNTTSSFLNVTSGAWPISFNLTSGTSVFKIGRSSLWAQVDNVCPAPDTNLTQLEFSNVANLGFYDISYNNGFSVGLSILATINCGVDCPAPVPYAWVASFWGNAYVAPPIGTNTALTGATTYNMTFVSCQNVSCPFAYGYPLAFDNECETQPCEASGVNYPWVDAAGKYAVFDVYVCNASPYDDGDAQTAGVCGCRQCPGIYNPVGTNCIADEADLRASFTILDYSWIYGVVNATGADVCCQSCPVGAYDYLPNANGTGETRPGALCPGSSFTITTIGSSHVPHPRDTTAFAILASLLGATFGVALIVVASVAGAISGAAAASYASKTI